MWWDLCQFIPQICPVKFVLRNTFPADTKQGVSLRRAQVCCKDSDVSPWNRPRFPFFCTPYNVNCYFDTLRILRSSCSFVNITSNTSLSERNSWDSPYAYSLISSVHAAHGQLTDGKKCSLCVFNVPVRDRTLLRPRRLMWMLLLKHDEEYLTGSGLESDCTYRVE